VKSPNTPFYKLRDTSGSRTQQLAGKSYKGWLSICTGVLASCTRYVKPCSLSPYTRYTDYARCVYCTAETGYTAREKKSKRVSSMFFRRQSMCLFPRRTTWYHVRDYENFLNKILRWNVKVKTPKWVHGNICLWATLYMKACYYVENEPF
jgi:hypothetical protein